MTQTLVGTNKFDLDTPALCIDLDIMEANIAKMLAAEASWHAAEACMQTFGGFAYAREYGIERKWRESRLYQTAPISTNMILAFVGQNVLGMPRSY